MTPGGADDGRPTYPRIAYVAVFIALAATIAGLAWFFREIGGRGAWETPPNEVPCTLVRTAHLELLEPALRDRIARSFGKGGERFESVDLPHDVDGPPEQRRIDCDVSVGGRIVVASFQWEARVWIDAELRHRIDLRGPKGYAAGKVAVAGDGSRFCAVFLAKKVKVFETGSGDEIATIEPQGPGLIEWLAWEPDGSALHVGREDQSLPPSRNFVETWNIGDRP